MITKSASPRWVPTPVHVLGHGLAVILGAFLFGMLVYSVVALFFFLGGVDIFADEPLPPRVFATLTAAQFIGFLLMASLYRWRSSSANTLHYRMVTKADFFWIFVGVTGIVGVAIGIDTIAAFLGIDPATNSIQEGVAHNSTRLLYLIPVTLLVTAPAEEVLFRGILQGYFRTYYGAPVAIILSSALFSCVHLLSVSGSTAGQLTYLIVVFSTGLLLGALYEYTENLIVPVAIHGFWNSLLFYSLLVSS